MVVNGDDAGGERRGVNSGEGIRIEGQEWISEMKEENDERVKWKIKGLYKWIKSL